MSRSKETLHKSGSKGSKSTRHPLQALVRNPKVMCPGFTPCCHLQENLSQQHMQLSLQALELQSSNCRLQTELDTGTDEAVKAQQEQLA